MSDLLLQAARQMSMARNVDHFWRLCDAALHDEGFEFVAFVHRDDAGRVNGRSNFGLYDALCPENDPFLAHCCDSYVATWTGVEFAGDYSYLDAAAHEVIAHAAQRGFRSGIGIPVEISDAARQGGYNLGTRLLRSQFTAQMAGKVEALRAFCLIAHRCWTEIDGRERAGRANGALAALSAREREVLALMAEGLTRPAIAVRLGVSANTVSTHVKAIYRKLEVGTQVDAARLYLSALR